MASGDWFADEGMWETLFPFFFTSERLAAGKSEAEAIGRLVGLEVGQVLDVGCGPGRHAVPLAKAGFVVTGVDRSSFLLGMATDAAAREGVSPEWIEQDMRLFYREESFDLAVCMLSSFGYFEEDADNRQVLRNVCRSLRSGGQFVLDIMGKEVLAQIFQPAGADRIPGVGTHFSEREWVEDLPKLENRWTVVTEDGSVKRYSLRHWVYTAHELRLMLLDSGFEEVRIFGGLSGEPYGPGAARLVALASRSC